VDGKGLAMGGRKGPKWRFLRKHEIDTSHTIKQCLRCTVPAVTRDSREFSFQTDPLKPGRSSKRSSHASSTTLNGTVGGSLLGSTWPPGWRGKPMVGDNTHPEAYCAVDVTRGEVTTKSIHCRHPRYYHVIVAYFIK
jgi:hypothetical protein